MPPSLVGASRHSIVRIGSGMSKCTSAISATVRSASSCIQSRKRSRPSMERAGSPSRAATASSTVLPGTMRSAVSTISSSSRLSSAQPQA